MARVHSPGARARCPARPRARRRGRGPPAPGSGRAAPDRARPARRAARRGRRGDRWIPPRGRLLSAREGAAQAAGGPVAAARRRARARAAQRGGSLALVPGRRPPAQGPIATAVEVDVAPAGVYRLPTAGRDGVLVARDGALVRVVYAEGAAAVVRAWVAGGRVRFQAEAPSRDAALAAIGRMRFALGTDHDLRHFHRRFVRDELIGPVIRRQPWLRPRRRPEPFEALAWAVCEQLIEARRAAGIERRMVRRLGTRSSCGTLGSPPAAERLAG